MSTTGYNHGLLFDQPPAPAHSYALRPYQQAFVSGVMSAFESVDSALCVMPTGTGKTVCFAHVAEAMRDKRGGRVLVLAHREELVRQGAEKMAAVSGDRVAIEMGQESSIENSGFRAPIVVATVQTMSRRLAKFQPDDFSLVIVDEAHHGTAKSYRTILDHFAKSKLLGVTATPDRADEEALGQIFEAVAFDYELADAIADGWLVPIEQQQIFCEGLDLSGVRTLAGDLNEGDLDRIMRQEEVIHRVVYPTIDLAGDRAALFFATSVGHAHQMADICNRHRAGSARAIDGSTPREVRRETLAQFKRGEFQYLCNCGVFLEGFDEPRIGVVAMARPTKSRSLYAQAVGRGTRPLAGVVDGLATAAERTAAIATSAKPACLVLDFVGNAGRHKLVSAADILGGKVSDDEEERELAEAVAEQAKAEIADRSRRGEAVDVRQLMERLAEEEAARRQAARALVKPKVNYRSRSVSAFDVFAITPKQSHAEHGEERVPTPKQRAYLRKCGIDEADRLTFAQASQLLGLIQKRRELNLCTFKQARCLKRAGYENAEKFGFAQASAIMDEVIRNNWRKTDRANQYAENWAGSRAAYEGREEVPF